MSVQVRCNCGYRMELPDEWAGKQGRCPQCSKVLHIPAKRPSTTAESPAAMPITTKQIEAERQSVSTTAAPSSGGPSPFADMLRSPLWLSAIGGGVLLILAGLYLVMAGGGPDVPPENSATTEVTQRGQESKSDGEASEVFRPTITSQDNAVEEVKAPSVVDGTKPSVVTTKNDSRPAPPAAKSGGGSIAPDAWTLRDYGVAIPPGVVAIEVDGVLLPVKNPAELASRGVVPLVLPMGKHIVRFARTGPARLVNQERWFLDAYREAHAQVQEDGRWSFDRLLELSRRNLDRFTEPLVPHLWGNYYWQEGQHDAAARHYRWALSIVPTFAPSYLNLALWSHHRGDDAAARRFLRLADLWNVQNAYGLSLASAALRATLDGEETTTDEDEPDWLETPDSQLSLRDHDMMAVLRSAAQFAPRVSERAKILNNLGAYFEHEGKPELALENYRTAAGALGSSKLSSEERGVIQAILENLARVCRAANMPESRRYERLQGMVEQ